jgi:N-acetyltransferase
MEYVPSAPEDIALHKKFHTQHINGVSMERDFLTKVKSEKAVWHGPQGDFIISLSGSQDPKHWLKKARAVFDMATSDLGAVDIPDEKLWGTQDTPGARNKATNAKEETKDRYKLYLYMDNGRCVGLCLAEGIEKAFSVIEPEKAEEMEKEREASDSAEARRTELLSISQDTDEAAIGISRIWTSRGSRKKGIARALLKCVAKTFLSKVTSKDMVAFSQPTEMGTALARRWFGQEYGWHVYID